MKDRISFIREVLVGPLTALVVVIAVTAYVWTHTADGRMLILIFREFPYYLPVGMAFGGWAQ